MILGLDLGSTTGWSLPHRHGEFEFTGSREEKIFTLYNRLLEEFQGEDVSAIIYERPFNRGLAATRMGWGMAGAVEIYSQEIQVGCVDMPPGTFKKWFTGNGHANKDDMIETARSLGYHLEEGQEHAADAIAVRLYGEANIKGL